VTVRTATDADTERIAVIYSESIMARDSSMDTEPVTTAAMQEKLRQLGPRETILVVEPDEGGVAGWGIVKTYSDRPGYAVACESSVYLDRSLTGKGYGSAVQQELHRFCRQAGYHHIVVKIWANNERSIAMHARNGFEMVGVQREIGRVDGQWRDIAIMQNILD